MSLRFDTQYRTKRLDNLGDPEWHNRRWADIDRRMNARELDSSKVDDAVDQLTAVALSRLNDTFSPIIAEAITRLTEFGLLFSATSHTERTIGVGALEFIIDEPMRKSYVATGFILIRPTDNLAIGMTARTLSYDNTTGVLAVESYSVTGAGTYNDWSITITGDPDLSHSTRTDNPHQVTANQVGAYTTLQTDEAITSVVSVAVGNAVVTVRGPAPAALDTIAKLASALNNDPNYIVTALTSRYTKAQIDNSFLSFQDPQDLSQPQRDQALANLGSGGGIWSTGDAKITFKQAADPGWVLANDGSLGDGSSGATTRADGDTFALFSLFWALNQSFGGICSISQASPAVITRTPHGMSVGQRVTFTTTGTLPSPLIVGTSYYVAATGYNANQFTLSTAPVGGTAINTTSVGSGTHSVFAYNEMRLESAAGAVVGRTTPSGDFGVHKRIYVPKTLGRALVIAGAGLGLSQRALGQTAGAETETQTISKLVSHSHPHDAIHQVDANHNWLASDPVNGLGGANIYNTGGNVPLDIMQPSTFVNFMIKL